MESSLRLQKFLAQAGIASRRQAEVLITEGKIKINGEVVTRLGTTVDPATDVIEYNGKKVKLSTKKVYLAFNKPATSIDKDNLSDDQYIAQLTKENQRLHQVNQADGEACGLLVLTNDQEFIDQCKHQQPPVTTEYFAVLDHDLDPASVERLNRGLRIGDQKVPGMDVASIRNKSARLIVSEKISRQTRRTLGQLGYTVKKLKRVRFGNLELGTLAEGKSRPIKTQDII